MSLCSLSVKWCAVSYIFLSLSLIVLVLTVNLISYSSTTRSPECQFM